MNIRKLLTAILVVAFFVFNSNYALAVIGEGDFRFRVDDELNTAITGAYARIKCSGDTPLVVADGGALDSNGTAGIIDIASTSAGFTAETGGAGCDTNDEAITVASASFPGYTWSTSNLLSTYKTATLNDAGASLSFSLKTTVVQNELSSALTINGTAASASVVGKTTTYSGGAAFIPQKVSDGAFTLTAGADGYVNKTVTTVTISSRSQQTVHFDDGADAGANDWVGNKLPHGYKFTVLPTVAYGEPANLTGATVTAGNSDSVACSESGSTGVYHCAVPLAHTGITAKAVKSGYENGTLTYALRTSGSGAQITGTLKPLQNRGGAIYPDSTPTPSPTLTPTPQPTPTPAPSPTPIPAATVVKLFRKVNDPKVYTQTSDGTIQWVRTLEDFNAAGYKWQDVKVVSGREFSGIVREAVGRPAEGKIRVLEDVRALRVRSGPSIDYRIISRVFANDILEFTEVENNWYRVQRQDKDFGWVSGEYVNEL